MKDKLYVVYHVKHNGKIVYIGSGTQHRPAHATSGVSHVYELNSLHHKGEQLDVDIVFRTLSKEESLVKEKEDILQYQPDFNTVYLKEARQKAASMAVAARSYMKKLKTEVRLNNNYSKASLKATDVMDIILDAFSIQQLIGGVQLEGFEHPPFPQIRRFIAGDKKTSEWYKIILGTGVWEFYRNNRKHCFVRLVVEDKL